MCARHWAKFSKWKILLNRKVSPVGWGILLSRPFCRQGNRGAAFAPGCRVGRTRTLRWSVLCIHWEHAGVEALNFHPCNFYLCLLLAVSLTLNFSKSFPPKCFRLPYWSLWIPLDWKNQGSLNSNKLFGGGSFLLLLSFLLSFHSLLVPLPTILTLFLFPLL